jgi:hypothetical protein
MAPAKKPLLALLPKSTPNATSGASASPSTRTKRPIETTTSSAAANNYSCNQVIMSLTSLQQGLTHVQTGLNDLLQKYMQHTSSILAGEDGELESLKLPPSVAATANAAMEAVTATGNLANGIGQSIMPAANQVETAAADGKTKKRKREKKERDPNAPKKPLTAAFLYAQTARPIVRQDLEAALEPGGILEKNAVNLEVNKRWNSLDDDAKEVSWYMPYIRPPI